MLLTFQVHAQIKYITTYHYTIQCTLLRYICHEHTNHKFMNCFFMFILIQNVHALTLYRYSTADCYNSYTITYPKAALEKRVITIPLAQVALWFSKLNCTWGRGLAGVRSIRVEAALVITNRASGQKNGSSTAQLIRVGRVPLSQEWWDSTYRYHVTLHQAAVFHVLTSQLNDEAPLNISLMLVTSAVFHWLRLQLNDEAPANIALISVTAAVSQ